ncbi:predicted protein [Lichtheimia corymbifera JMRC:FSU:9682]|uniref:Uncharacterized protein n=1 Tax=Lichtheimia corymbifera JMRC:FSU:9682 TaxID=1263082 RepID=A0A068RVE4_9FUNG|nr:predicted protein [Lichtheimia corymbifera JMRC:FSU:9682]
MSEEEDPVTHKLYDELDELLRIFCSNAQQQFCIDQEVASRSQLYHIQQTMQQVQRFIPVVGLIGNTNADSLRHTLTMTALEMLELYETACRQRHIRSLTSLQAEDLLISWHELSQDYEDKTAEHAVFTRLLGDIANLHHVWRNGPEHVESVVISLLASRTSDVNREQQGMYLATVDRHNYARLGLGRRWIGTRQIVFECRQISREEQEKTIAGVCQRFARIFMQNAQQNLEQLEAQRQMARPTALAAKLRQFYSKVFYPLTNNNHNNNNSSNGHHSNNTPITMATAEHKVTPFRLTTGTITRSFIWYPSDEKQEEDSSDACQERNENHDNDQHADKRSCNNNNNNSQHQPIIGTIPTPSFIPAPWQWPDMLKPRTPYHPHLFGLMRGHDKRAGSAAPFATVAVHQLCGHLSRVGQQFYEDVTNNAKLGYHQDSRVLQGIGMDLVEMYKCLQLELSRQAMQQVMAIVQQLHPSTLPHPPHPNPTATATITTSTSSSSSFIHQQQTQQQQDNTTQSTHHTHS